MRSGLLYLNNFLAISPIKVLRSSTSSSRKVPLLRSSQSLLPYAMSSSESSSSSSQISSWSAKAILVFSVSNRRRMKKSSSEEMNFAYPLYPMNFHGFWRISSSVGGASGTVCREVCPTDLFREVEDGVVSVDGLDPISLRFLIECSLWRIHSDTGGWS